MSDSNKRNFDRTNSTSGQGGKPRPNFNSDDNFVDINSINGTPDDGDTTRTEDKLPADTYPDPRQPVNLSLVTAAPQTGFTTGNTFIDGVVTVGDAWVSRRGSPTEKALWEAGKATLTELKGAFPKGEKPVDIGSPPPPGGKKSNFDAPTSSKGYVIALNRKPEEVKFRTGIIPPIFNPMFNQGNHLHSSLYISQMYLTLPTTGDPETYWDSVLSVALQNKLQESVNFAVSLTDMSSARMKTYFNLILESLQVYYFILSILQYSSNPDNKNDGMTYLRKFIDAGVYSDLVNLEKVLEGLPIPNNFISLAYWLGSCYFQSDLPNGTVCKIVPFQMDGFTASRMSVRLKSLLNSLSDPDMRSTSSLLGRCVPAWISDSKALPAPIMKAIYDPNFNTLWSNLSYKYTDAESAAVCGPSVLTSDTAMYYVRENDLDGAVFGLFDFFAYESNFAVHGMWQHLYTTGSSTRFNYEDGLGLVKTTDNSTTIYHRGIYRGEAHVPVWNGETYSSTTHNPPGYIRVQDVNVTTVSDATKKLLDWMFDIKSIKSLKTPAQRGQGGKSYSK